SGHQRRSAGALSVLASELDEAPHRNPAAAPRVRARIDRVRGVSEPQDPRVPAPRRPRDDSRRRQLVALRPARGARFESVRRPHSGGDERPDGVPADWRPAVLPHAWSVRVVLVLAAARRTSDGAGGTAGTLERRRRGPRRKPADAAGRRRMAERSRRRRAPRPRASGPDAVSAAAALVLREVAAHPPGAVLRLGADPYGPTSCVRVDGEGRL